MTPRECTYTPLNESEFEEMDEDSPTTKRYGYFEFWGVFSWISHEESPFGILPLALSETVGIIRDKTTGRACMSRVNQIKFK